MRKASRCFARLLQPVPEYRASASTFHPLQAALSNYSTSSTTFSCPLIGVCYKQKHWHLSCRHFSTGHCSRKRHHDKKNSSLPQTVLRSSVEQDERSPDPATWLARLDQYLPSRLRNPKSSAGPDHVVDLDLSDLNVVLSGAKEDAGVDLWEWMVEHGHNKPAVWLMNAALRKISTNTKTTTLRHPSNLAWPGNLFREIDSNPVRSDLSLTTPDVETYETCFSNSEFFRSGAHHDYAVLSTIWASLGRLVANAANSVENQEQSIMSVVLLVLGQIHKLGLMPKDIYENKILHQSTYTKRPPILHLVSSRILTTLSDATWREQQDEAIAQAAESGRSLKEISQDVPGGRFRLKVRPLGPEIWLELILWCCAEAGHVSAAASIINALQSQVADPWFAIRWCSSQENDKLNVSIDWDRMKLRHGGTVGLIEGYSREKPFVDVPARTISVEVVLALIEAVINSTRPSHMLDSDQNFQTIEWTTNRVRDMLTFLEPHDLPPDYLDYLEARLMHVGVFDIVKRPSELRSWTSTLGSSRALEQVKVPKHTVLGLGLDSINEHSLLHIGIQHQAMDASIQLADIHGALAVFNDIQENVDQNKIRSISEFLRVPVKPQDGFFSGRTFQKRLEFADSHGQMPFYKLAGFLNLISDTKLTGLGQWLLYSNDIDGAFIPESAYDQPSMAAALCKFAAVTQDEELFAKAGQIYSSKWLQTVRLRRSLANADLAFYDIHSARRKLSSLRTVQAGGIGVSNIVHLAATILRLENNNPKAGSSEQTVLMQARRLMIDILDGKFNCVRSDFTMLHRMVFKQQVSHLLRLFASLEGCLLQQLAQAFAHKYRSGNVASLQSKDFNVLLAAIVELKGSYVGRGLWNLFCKDYQDSHHFDIDDVGFDAENGIYSTSVESAIDATIKEDEIPFENPFFAQPEQQELQSKSNTSSLFTQRGSPSNPVPTTATPKDPLLAPLPITVPNLQTFRIILRAAVAERQHRRAKGIHPHKETRIISWAFKKLRQFGITDHSILAQEVENPISEIDADVEDHVDMPETPERVMRYTRVKTKLPRDTRISDLWSSQR